MFRSDADGYPVNHVDGWKVVIPDLAGEGLKTVGCETTCELRTDRGWCITIENDYAFDRPGQPALETDAGDEGQILKVLHSLVGSPIRVSAAPSGDLALTVGDATLRVAAAPGFESWSMVGLDQQRVVCTPGGELVTWGPADR